MKERVKELEKELAEAKDDSSSSSSEKEDHSAELEQWKKKFEKVTEEFETYQRRTQSEIKELNITVDNLEKRNIELKLQLKKSGVELDESS